MKIRKRGVSDNIEDRRGQRASGGISGMGGIAKLGIPGILIAIVLAVIGGQGGLGGGGGGGFDITDIFQQLPAAPVADSSPLPGAPDPQADMVEFVSFVLDDIQVMWTDQFSGGGEPYREAQLVLFTDSVSSACGNATSAVGPFYCPADEKVYIDLDFFDELSERFGAPGDFAQAYVIAHEIGHHVQNVTGISSQVRRLQQENPDDANDLSIRQELQADCLAGVWGYSTYQRDILESGDLEEGLGAAAAVGDDRIQKTSTGQINPDTWTHGSSEQRMKWFRIGFDTGDPAECDTFSGNY
ncbi:MAG: KPN_02809 family neutral zinc metallopeptidase [Tepidiformaceae bacterium]